MATLTPKITLCFEQLCKKIRATDITGLYNTTTNTGGYSNAQTGVLSGQLSDIDSAYFTLTPLGSVQHIANWVLKDSSVNLYPAQATPSFSFPLLDSHAGLVDGVYKLTYKVVLTPNPGGHLGGIYEANILIHCAADNCVSNLWQKFAISGEEEDKKAAMQAEALLRGAKALFLCNDETNAQAIAELLAKVCKITAGCGCGC